MYLDVRTEVESYVKDELVEFEFDQSKDIVDKKVKKLIEEEGGCIYLDDFFNVIENLKKLEKERIL